MLDEFTDAYKTEVASFSPCRPEPAAIACAFRTALLHHVGLVVDVDGRLMVLDIRRKKGAGLSPIGDFERRYQRVEYYRDAEQ